jgi:hypothetical protein
MKNQYVGDINDFKKYGLIEAISRVFGSKVLFVWMLTSSHDGDWNKTAYLDQPAKYQALSPGIFDVLKKIVENREREIDDNIDNILALEKNPLFKDYTFINDFLKDNADEREKYFKNVYDKAKNCDLIFLDPDNGIEVQSHEYGKKQSSKYVYWREIETLTGMKKDILIYQHFPRETREEFVRKTVHEFEVKCSGFRAIPFVTPNVLFVLITNKSGEVLIKLKKELENWKGEIDYV